VPTPRAVPAAAPKEETAECRVRHALPCGIPEPCMVVRFRFGFLRQRSEIAVFHGDRGIHPGMPCRGGQLRVQPPPGDRSGGGLDQDLRGAQVLADGLRIGVYRQGPGPLAERSGCAIQVHRFWIILAKRAEERFNGSLRNEFLNQRLFHHVEPARALVRLYVGK
jgi:hypothetical protein